jgi:hypothetical protein
MRPHIITGDRQRKGTVRVVRWRVFAGRETARARKFPPSAAMRVDGAARHEPARGSQRCRILPPSVSYD